MYLERTYTTYNTSIPILLLKNIFVKNKNKVSTEYKYNYKVTLWYEEYKDSLSIFTVYYIFLNHDQFNLKIFTKQFTEHKNQT